MCVSVRVCVCVCVCVCACVRACPSAQCCGDTSEDGTNAAFVPHRRRIGENVSILGNVLNGPPEDSGMTSDLQR